MKFLHWIFIFISIPHLCFAYQVSGELDFVPWSGYWWPTYIGALYNGYNSYNPHPSPMEKYDLCVQGSYPGSLSAYAKTPDNRVYQPEVPGWWGLCDSLANAALLENVKFSSSFHKNILFNIGDKKGLLTLVHADDPKLVKYCTSTPIAFHTYLLTYLYEQKIGIAADLEAGDEFWSYPIYKFQMDITPGQSSDAVRCTIFYTNDLGILPDFNGSDILQKTYTYSLEKDADGTYTGGKWNSGDRPDMVWVPVEQHTDIPGFTYQTVKEITSSSGDDWAGINALSSGHYALILEKGQQREFQINTPAGSILDISFATDPQSQEGKASFNLKNSLSQIVGSEDFSSVLNNISVSSLTATEFTLELLAGQSSRFDQAVHVYIDILMPEVQNFYEPALGVDDPSTWNGLAVVNSDPDESANPLLLTVMGENGLPLYAGTPPVTLNTAEKWLGLIPLQNGFDHVFAGKPAVLRVSSSRPVNALSLLGKDEMLCGTPRPSKKTSQLVIPAMTDPLNFKSKASLVISNQSSESKSASLRYFSDRGKEYETVVWDIPGAETKTYSSSYPGNKQGNYWGLLSFDEVNGSLEGTDKIEENRKNWDQLPLLVPAQSLIAPHIAADNYWETTLTLFSLSAEVQDIAVVFYSPQETSNVSIALSPYSKNSFAAQDLFPELSDQTLNSGWFKLESKDDIAGYMTFKSSTSISSLPLWDINDISSSNRLPHVVSDDYWWTGIALLNPQSTPASAVVKGYAANGNLLGQALISIAAMQKKAIVSALLFPDLPVPPDSLHIEADQPLAAFAFYGASSSQDSVLSAISF